MDSLPTRNVITLFLALGHLLKPTEYLRVGVKRNHVAIKFPGRALVHAPVKRSGQDSSPVVIDDEVEALLEPVPPRRVRLTRVGPGVPRARASPALALTLLERWRARRGQAAITASSIAV